MGKWLDFEGRVAIGILSFLVFVSVLLLCYRYSRNLADFFLSDNWLADLCCLCDRVRHNHYFGSGRVRHRTVFVGTLCDFCDTFLY